MLLLLHSPDAGVSQFEPGLKFWLKLLTLGAEICYNKLAERMANLYYFCPHEHIDLLLQQLTDMLFYLLLSDSPPNVF
jgi:hypothetical protein